MNWVEIFENLGDLVDEFLTIGGNWGSMGE